ncbi:hypothetical protein HU200_062641 [Digitaria exilis]|uniref:Uncharacterized protein n=1 Tax=Digitaria exilis TaxID=1010633 RepID=A0A835DX96_9POAL|nr:hypothetical protein HU200_062641 [Digitaria exilis]
MSVFTHVDKVDVVLMLLGLVGALGNGMSYPLSVLLYIRIINDIGRGPDLFQDFTSRINTIPTRGTSPSWRAPSGSWRS